MAGASTHIPYKHRKNRALGAPGVANKHRKHRALGAPGAEACASTPLLSTSHGSRHVPHPLGRRAEVSGAGRTAARVNGSRSLSNAVPGEVTMSEVLSVASVFGACKVRFRLYMTYVQRSPRVGSQPYDLRLASTTLNQRRGASLSP